MFAVQALAACAPETCRPPIVAHTTPISRIRILNPLPGRNAWTSATRAAKYVRQARAEWTADRRAIRMLACHHANQQASESAAGYGAAVRVGIATQDEMRNLPITGDLMRLLTVRGKR